MIRNWQEAFVVLGVSVGASFDDCRRAYKVAIKSLHPDNNDCAINNRYYLVTEAFSYLNDLYDNGLWPVTNTPNQAVAARGSKIIGKPVHKDSGSENIQAAIRLNQEKKKKEALLKKKELEKEAIRLRQEQRLKEEQELLDEIRWMRVAGIISDTIARDNREKDIDAKLKNAFAQHDKNVLNDRYRKSDNI